MKKKLSKKSKQEIVELINNNLQGCDISEIDGLLDYLTKDEIKDCLKYGNCESFIPCIKRKYNDAVEHEKQSNRSVISKKNPYQ
jgi:hypothetical protein